MITKLRLILWKNFKIHRRFWYLTLLEVLIPIILFGVAAYCRSQVSGLSKTRILEPTYYDIKDEEALYQQIPIGSMQIWYAPNTTSARQIIRKVQEKFIIPHPDIMKFESEDKLLEYYNNYKVDDVQTIVAVIFNEQNPKQLNYDLRFYENNLEWNTKKLYTSMFAQDPLDKGSSKYIYTGFVGMQIAINKGFLKKELKKNDLNATISLQQFPDPPRVEDSNMNKFTTSLLPFITIFSYIFLSLTILQNLVTEKSSGFRALLARVGLKDWMFWFGWFLHYFVPSLLSVGVLVIFMKVSFGNSEYPAIEFCDGGVLFVFLSLYLMATITFSFMISALFSKSLSAIFASLSISFFSYFMSSAFLMNSNWIVWIIKIFFGIFPNVTLRYGYDAISTYELREIGTKWNNIFQSGSESENDVTMFHVFMLFVVQNILFILLTIYIDYVNPGKYGFGKLYYFPVKIICDIICKRNLNKKTLLYSSDKDHPDPYIEIKELSKKYGEHTVLDNINLKLCCNGLILLCGENGAGKTTLLSIISGMNSQTSGTIECHGKKATEYCKGMKIGVCPQKNVLFSYLTVKEHLKFLSILRENNFKKADKQADDILKQLNLVEDKNKLPEALSEGNKRKLCLGMALTGDTEILIIDEPAEELDTKTRLEFWNLLKKLKKDITILLCSHLVNEVADFVDYMCVMSKGKIKVYNKPMRLKQKYGVGYRLLLSFNSDTPPTKNDIKNIETECNLTYFNHNGNVFVFKPYTNGFSNSNCFIHLEDNQEKYGISDMKITFTTLEDVLLKLNEYVDLKKETRENETLERGHKSLSDLWSKLKVYNDLTQENKKLKSRHETRSDSMLKRNSSEHIDFQKETQENEKLKSCSDLILNLHDNLQEETQENGKLKSIFSNFPGQNNNMNMNKYKMLFRKRWYCFKRTFHDYIPSTLMALVYFITVIFLFRVQTDFRGEGGPALTLNLNSYEESVVYYNTSNSNFTRYFIDLVKYQNSKPILVDNVTKSIISRGEDNIAFYKKHMIAAAEFKINEINCLYSDFPLHSAPISINLAMNSLAKSLLGPEYSIVTRNTPLRSNLDTTSANINYFEAKTIWLTIVPLGCFLLICESVIFPSLEIVSGFFEMQRSAGISVIFYWLINAIFDICIYFAQSILVVLVLIIINMCSYGLFSINELGALYTIVFIYSLTTLPFNYLISYKQYKVRGSCLLIIVNFLLGFILLNIVSFSSTKNYIIICLEMIFPPFAIYYLNNNFIEKYVKNFNWENMDITTKDYICLKDNVPCCPKSKNETQCSTMQSYFLNDNSSIYLDFFYMFLSFVVCLLLSWFLISIWTKKKSLSFIKIHNINNRLSVKEIKKTFKGQLAVDSVSFDVNIGECFGIVGANGAGKTTLFKILAGLLSPASGNISLKNIGTERKNYVSKREYKKYVTYCSQENVCNYILTVKEHLLVMATLWGYPKPKDVAKTFISVFHLEEFVDKPFYQCSGGIKSRLSIALALIGFPKVVLLDEATNGIDPANRQRIWNVINHFKTEYKTSFILSSHNMVECENLCDKIAIIKNGKIEYQGLLSNIKNKFHGGFFIRFDLKFYIDSTELENIKKEIKSIFSGEIEFKCKKYGALLVHGNRNEKLSELFEISRKIKNDFSCIEDFTITNTTLMDVILSIDEYSEAQTGITQKRRCSKLCL